LYNYYKDTGKNNMLLHISRGGQKVSAGLINTAYFSGGGRFAAVSYDDNTVRMINIRTGTSSDALTGHTGAIRAAVFGDNGNVVVTGGRDSNIIVWKNNTAVKLLKAPARVKALALNTSLKLLFAGLEDGSIVCYKNNFTETQQLKGFSGARVQSLTISKYGNYLVATGSNGQVHIYDHEGHLLQSIADAGSIDFALADEKQDLLITASSRRQIKIYSLSTPARKPLVISDIPVAIKAISLSSEGLLSVALANKTIRHYRTQSEDLANMVKSHLTQNLTEKEWGDIIGKDVPYRQIIPSSSD
jgi:WD40 repeat protein